MRSTTDTLKKKLCNNSSILHRLLIKIRLLKKAKANQKHTKLDKIAFILFILLLSYLVDLFSSKNNSH